VLVLVAAGDFWAVMDVDVRRSGVSTMAVYFMVVDSCCCLVGDWMVVL
jgi:hypothetical protein